MSLENFARPVAAVLRYAAYALALSACTSFAAGGDVDRERADQAGSGGSASCGDVRSSEKNCGFCGHACGAGETCTDGLCPSTDVLSTPGLKGFATDGNALFYIDQENVYACKAAGGGCGLFVTPQDAQLVAPTKAPALEPSQITMKPDRVFIADNAFRAILSCPVAEKCGASLRVINDRNSDGQPIRGLAAGAGGVAWTRADMVRGTPFAAFLLPGPAEPAASAGTPATVSASAIVPYAEFGGFWLASSGVYRAEVLGGPSDLVTSRIGNDLAMDGRNAYLASADGLFGYDATSQESLAAAGAFVKVAADARSIVAVARRDGTSTVVDVHGGAAHALAITNDDVVALALAGDYVYFASTSTIRRVRR